MAAFVNKSFSTPSSRNWIATVIMKILGWWHFDEMQAFNSI